jgi:periplasmic protein TonB
LPERLQRLVPRLEHGENDETQRSCWLDQRKELRAAAVARQSLRGSTAQAGRETPDLKGLRAFHALARGLVLECAEKRDMAHATMVPPLAPPAHQMRPETPEPQPAVRFESLVLTRPQSLAKGRSATLVVSIVTHLALVTAIVILPLLAEQTLPAPDEAIRAFFVMPVAAAAPPPPPPPPAAGVRAPTRAAVAPRPVEEPQFVAPIEVPTEVQPEQTLDLGVEGGVPGGVEGGVPGGVVGGIVGGLAAAETAPPVKAVRVGGQLKAPKLLHRVAPPYPLLAETARISMMLILEAEVGTDGRVQRVTVLRGHPLFDETGMAAVKQWRYQPLLLNGVPTPFILSVTLNFSMVQAASQ